jgi:L-asparaginase II
MPVSTMTSAPRSPGTPVLVEVSRGDMVECRHRGSIAVVDIDGKVVFATGDIESPVYARSAFKPLQAIPLVESGAADREGPEQIAVACASHSGEPRHTRTVAAWLGRIGLGEPALRCGAHMPYHAPTAEAMIRAGEQPTQIHNNCSGKHTGMLATCVACGDPVEGYLEPEHPQQRRVLAAFETMCGMDLRHAPRGIDGCGLPQIGIPLHALARGMARLGTPHALAAGRARACTRIGEAIRAHPFLVAGSGRFCTRAIEAAGGAAILKTGAEGNFMGAFPGTGLGFALKIDDGAQRAAEVAAAQIVLRFAKLDDAARTAVTALTRAAIENRAGRQVGAVAPAAW